MDAELATARGTVVELRQQMQQLEAAQNYKQAAQNFAAAERSVLLAKISDIEQDRARIEKQLHLRFAHNIANSEDSIKAILADKDSEIDRLKGVIMREQADTSLRMQTVQQAQVSYRVACPCQKFLVAGGVGRCYLFEAKADACAERASKL